MAFPEAAELHHSGGAERCRASNSFGAEEVHELGYSSQALLGEVVEALDDLTLGRAGHAAIFLAYWRFATGTADIRSVRSTRGA